MIHIYPNNIYKKMRNDKTDSKFLNDAFSQIQINIHNIKYGDYIITDSSLS